MLLTIAFISGAFSFVCLPIQNQIVSPRLTIPVILLPGQTFELELKHSVPVLFADWRVQLINQYEVDVIDLPVLDTRIGFSNTHLNINVPTTVTPGRYTLIVSRAGEISDSIMRRENSVHIRKQFSDDFSVIQLADLPTLGGDGSGDKKLNTIIDEINIINPDVVMFSGDVAYGGSWDQYERLLRLLKKFTMPVIAVPGNHEYHGWGGYLHLLGQPYHQVTFGNYQIVSLNSGHGRDQFTISQLAWFKRITQQSDAKYRLLQLHHPIQHRQDLSGYLRANREQVLKTITDSGVAIVLSGHWHGDSVYDQTGKERTNSEKIEGPPFVVTTTAGADLRPKYSNSELHHGYRLIRFLNGELENYTYDYDGDGVRDAASSIPMGKLTVTPRGRFGVVVNNSLNEGFLNAKVGIRIPNTVASYSPSRGTILRIDKREKESVFTLLVDLPANQSIEINMVQDGYKERP